MCADAHVYVARCIAICHTSEPTQTSCFSGVQPLQPSIKQYLRDNLITQSALVFRRRINFSRKLHGSRVSIGFASVARDSRMERNLVKTLDDTHDKEGTIGCILADHAGLCLAVKGDASSDSAGLIAAIADLVAKLEPKSGSPIISLQNDNRQCIILRKEPVVGAIYKDMST